MPDDNVKSLLESVWGKREMGLDIPMDLMRSVSHEDVEYLRNYRYPFLQIINTEAKFSGEVNPEFITVETSKWVIFDYGDAMCSAVPHDYKHKQEGAEEAGGDEGSGTIVWQQRDTARAMIEAAKRKGWAAVEFVDGTSLMQFYAWIAAQELDIEVQGYSPSEEQRRRYDFMKGEKEKKEVKKAKGLTNADR